MSLTVRFYDHIDDARLAFAVIVARYGERWVFCRHRQRRTYELAGGHREPGESIVEAATRELYEETGALDFRLHRISVYSVTGKTRVNVGGAESFGMLYYAAVSRLGALPPSEIGEVVCFEELPKAWTYPEIQPLLMAKVQADLAADYRRRSGQLPPIRGLK
ncbi:MAG: NUDIX domain-containing protein [Sporolactobacillus sp.]